MKESLEVRVPMLDEDLFAFGLSLPHRPQSKRADMQNGFTGDCPRRLPHKVADKPKLGFGIPVDTWVNSDFKARLRDAVLGPSSRLPEFFRPEGYRSMMEAFCAGRAYPGISRQGLYQRAVMLLSVELALSGLHHPGSRHVTMVSAQNERLAGSGLL